MQGPWVAVVAAGGEVEDDDDEQEHEHEQEQRVLFVAVPLPLPDALTDKLPNASRNADEEEEKERDMVPRGSRAPAIVSVFVVVYFFFVVVVVDLLRLFRKN